MPIGPNLGYKLFTTGAVLTASQVQQNLANQSVLFYADAAARDAAGSRRAPAAAQEQVIARTRQRASPRTPRQRLRDLCALELHF